MKSIKSFSKKLFKEAIKVRTIIKQKHIELTTIIGCRSMCKYCPQATIVQAYFKDNPDREKELTAKNLEKYLKNIPDSMPISFAGFSEPLAAKEILKICSVLDEQKRTVYVNTTLFNVRQDTVNNIFSNHAFEFVQIHIPDKNNWTKIKNDIDYKRKIATVISNIDTRKTTLVFTCLGDVPEDLYNFINRFNIKHYENFGAEFIQDRNGYVDDFFISERLHHKGEIICAKTQNEFTFNVLLPDGSLCLCCMDYGLENIIGNLNENTYEEILNSDKMLQIKEKMKEEDNDLCCRRCYFAGPVDDIIYKTENKTVFKAVGSLIHGSF